MGREIPKKKLTLIDIIIIASVVILIIASAYIIYSNHSTSGTAVIHTADNEFSVSLSEDNKYKFSSNGYSFCAEVKDGEISIKSADCPDGICKSSPAIGKRNGTIVCVPACMYISCEEGVSEQDNADFIIP